MAAFDSSFDATSLQGLSSLRSASHTVEAQRAVAKQFESLFLNMMIKQMRSAGVIDGGLIDRERLELQQNMYDEQLALNLAKGDGIGLADAIFRSISGPGVTMRSSTAGAAIGLPGYAHGRAEARLALDRPNEELPASAASGLGLERQRDAALRADTPEEFVASVWPHAERAGQALGIDPDVIVAQAALETGWGQSMPQNQYGESSLNLFGIKAGPEWRGPFAVKSTLEFVDGIPERRREPFRMYSSLSESFDDYVHFLRTRTRYSEALGAATPESFARGLQRAGYATDPNYADKLIGILERGLPGRDLGVQ